jgi:hypothetical protein
MLVFGGFLAFGQKGMSLDLPDDRDSTNALSRIIRYRTAKGEDLTLFTALLFHEMPLLFLKTLFTSGIFSGIILSVCKFIF